MLRSMARFGTVQQQSSHGDEAFSEHEQRSAADFSSPLPTNENRFGGERAITTS
jgi:hypothetical protein